MVGVVALDSTSNCTKFLNPRPFKIQVVLYQKKKFQLVKSYDNTRHSRHKNCVLAQDVYHHPYIKLRLFSLYVLLSLISQFFSMTIN